MTTRTLREYEYLEPESVGEAVSMLAQHGGEAKPLAGGTDLLVYMKRRILTPRVLVNLKTIPGLKYIEEGSGGLRIGALTTIRAVEKSDIVAKRFQALRDAAEGFGTVQVQNMGTIGGNICNASPGADLVVPSLALGAQVKIVGPNGEKTLPLDGFFTGPDKSILKPDQILAEIIVPTQQPSTGSSFMKLSRVSVDLAKINAAAAVTVKGETCESAGIAMGAVAPTPIRAKQAEVALRGRSLTDEAIEKAAQLASAESSPRTSLRSTAEYKREAVKTLVKRCLKKAAERALEES